MALLAVGEGDLGDVGQLAVPAVVVESVAHHEGILDLEPGKIGLERNDAAGRLVEQRAGADAPLR